jgi:hypothetical protein
LIGWLENKLRAKLCGGIAAVAAWFVPKAGGRKKHRREIATIGCWMGGPGAVVDNFDQMEEFRRAGGFSCARLAVMNGWPTRVAGSPVNAGRDPIDEG